MIPLENETFLTELGKLFEKSKGGGPRKLSITMKRYSGQTKPTPQPQKLKKTTATSQQPISHHNQSHPSGSLSSSVPKGGSEAAAKGGPQEKLCLVRAKLGRKTRISTVVHAKEANKFLLAYTQVLKSHTADALKKREK